MAHELRTPLNAIIPVIRMMLATMKGDLTPRTIKYLTIILNSALHLEKVIDDALYMSRLENNKFSLFKEFFNLRNSITEVCEIM